MEANVSSILVHQRVQDFVLVLNEVPKIWLVSILKRIHIYILAAYGDKQNIKLTIKINDKVFFV